MAKFLYKVNNFLLIVILSTGFSIVDGLISFFLKLASLRKKNLNLSFRELAEGPKLTITARTEGRSYGKMSEEDKKTPGN